MSYFVRAAFAATRTSGRSISFIFSAVVAYCAAIGSIKYAKLRV